MKTRLYVFLACFLLGLLAVCWSRAQTASHPTKGINNGVKIHTLMWDQHDALAGRLEATGQTSALELCRQYRCTYSAALSLSELEDTVAILHYVRQGQSLTGMPCLSTLKPCASL